jgi:hypothetical protein
MRYSRVRRPAVSFAVAAACSLMVLGTGVRSASASSFYFKAVFQANNGYLAFYNSSGSNGTTSLGMMAGTSPTVTQLADGTYEAAFEADNDTLAMSHIGGGWSGTTLGMDSGSSPAIASLPGGGFVVAFQDNDHQLYLFESNGNQKINVGLGMYPGTEPAIAVQSDGSFRVLFEANNGLLAGYNSSGSNFTTGYGMMAGTSPSIAAAPDGSYYGAFEANTSDLATVHIGSGISVNTTTNGMYAGTDPAIAVQSDGSFRVLFEANNGLLAGYNSSGSNFTTGYGMMAGTSPSIAAAPDGSYYGAFEANTSDLATVHIGSGISINTTTNGMLAKTSPSLPVPAPTAATAGGCGSANDCTRQTFAQALLGYIGAPDTAANEYAVVIWESAEGVDAACADQTANASSWPAPWSNGENVARGNPLATTMHEPGSSTESGNTDGVQSYVTGSGRTCWQWGIKANGDTLGNGAYGNILAVLGSPASSNSTQCVDLAQAVGASPWGTGNFSADC